MKKSRVIYWWAAVGFVVALCVALASYFITQPSTQLSLDTLGAFQNLFLLVCPPSIGFMAMDNGPRAVQIVGALIVALENAGLYAIVGAFFRWISRKMDGTPLKS